MIPGHGRISDETEVANYRDMVTIVRDRVAALDRGGMTLRASAGRAADDATTTASTTSRAAGPPSSSSPRCIAISKERRHERAHATAAPLHSRLRRGAAFVARTYGRGAQPSTAAARHAQRARTSADRYHGAMGGRRQRGLAVAHGDAARRRHREHSAQRTGRAAAAAWDLDRDRREGGFCRAFGRAGAHSAADARCASNGRMPTRCACSSTPAADAPFCTSRRSRPRERSLQGDSTANWFRQTQSRGVFAANTPRTGGSLRPHTTNLTGGYLRPNGVPYSEQATVKEFFNTFALAGRRRHVARRDDRRQRPRVSDDGLAAEHAVQEGDRPLGLESSRVRYPATDRRGYTRMTCGGNRPYSLTASVQRGGVVFQRE